MNLKYTYCIIIFIISVFYVPRQTDTKRLDYISSLFYFNCLRDKSTPHLPVLHSQHRVPLCMMKHWLCIFLKEDIQLIMSYSQDKCVSWGWERENLCSFKCGKNRDWTRIPLPSPRLQNKRLTLALSVCLWQCVFLGSPWRKLSIIDSDRCWWRGVDESVAASAGL